MSSSEAILSNNSVNNDLQSKPSCAWSKVPAQTTNACMSLQEVMSEQLAQELEQRERDAISDDSYIIVDKSEAEEPAVLLDTEEKKSEDKNLDTDFMLAQLMQLEFDKEYDMALKKQENLRNKNSHVTISYDKFKSVHPLIDKEEENNEQGEEQYSSSDSEDTEEKLTFKRGVRGKGENMISKHDLLLSARNNGTKLMKFPPEFDTGDGHSFDFRLSNRVFNELKMHSFHEGKRGKVHDKKDKSTAVMSLDPKTRLILFKLVNADILDSVGGVISTGKEATIIYANGGKSEEVVVPDECVLKVFKTTLNEFKTREKYIAEDYRFKDRYKHLNPQKIVKLWAEKEMHNLMKMRRFDIPCPDVVLLKKHVLLMSFIGEENKPAPKLKDAVLSNEQMQSAYDQCVEIMLNLYHKCHLVHADFNQFNLLWHHDRVWVIDVSQSVEPQSPMGLEFLYRDCKNMHKFFDSKLENVFTPEELFTKITDIKLEGKDDYFLDQINKYVKDRKIETKILPSRENDEKEYNFDFHFEKTLLDHKRRRDEKDYVVNKEMQPSKNQDQTTTTTTTTTEKKN